MFSILKDPSFYLLLSILSLVAFIAWKFKNKITELFKNYISSISNSINDSHARKNNAFLELTKTNQRVNKLPEEVEKIRENYSISDSWLDKEFAKEITKVENLMSQRLEHFQNLKIKMEFAEKVDFLCEKFKNDIKTCSLDEKQKLLEQSINLLSEVSL
jgi:F0F1-type ATP synthase membrane subunit b/b'